jgi:Fe-S cluster assembly iron-binding protein IscA
LGLALDEPQENEKSLQINEVAVLIEERIRPFTVDQILDYIHSHEGQGFVFTRAAGEGCC